MLSTWLKVKAKPRWRNMSEQEMGVTNIKVTSCLLRSNTEIDAK